MKKGHPPALQADRPPTNEPLDAHNFQNSVALLNSLIADTHSVTTFLSKWQTIRTKLHSLSFALSSAILPSPSPDLLHSITQTARETQRLLPSCTGGKHSHPLAGKLLVRSNLDQLTFKLDFHLRSIAASNASSVLSHSFALVAARPSPTATCDDLRFYVRDLSTRLDVGDLETRTRALSSLVEALNDDDRYVRLVTLEEKHIVHSLVAFLEFGNAGERVEAAKAASSLSSCDEGKAALVTSGAIGPLVRAAERGISSGREQAAKTLAKLTENGDNAWAVCANGGPAILINVVKNELGSRNLAGAACAVLRNLATVAEVRGFMLERGAVEIFLKLLRASREESLLLHAIDMLLCLASDDPDVRSVILRRGGVESLLRVLDPACSTSGKLRLAALRAVEGLCFTGRGAIASLVGVGFLEGLLAMLQNGEEGLREAAAIAAARLCAASDEGRRAMGGLGFVEELVAVMERGPAAVREAAARALAGMVEVGVNRRRFAREEVVARVVAILEGEERATTRRALLQALAAVSDCKGGRRRIAAACDVGRLARAEDGDEAKRMVRKIQGVGGGDRWRRAFLGLMGRRRMLLYGHN